MTKSRLNDGADVLKMLEEIESRYSEWVSNWGNVPKYIGDNKAAHLSHDLNFLLQALRTALPEALDEIERLRAALEEIAASLYGDNAAIARKALEPDQVVKVKARVILNGELAPLKTESEEK